MRPDSELRDSVKIGNFVELKKAVVGKGTKAGHHSYLGDAVIGEAATPDVKLEGSGLEADVAFAFDAVGRYRQGAS